MTEWWVEEVSAVRALLVYESMFGNTQAIARAVAGGLSDGLAVEVVEVGEAPGAADGFDLLVAGGPTHAFGMSRPQTRESAAQEAVPVSGGIGLREWLAGLDEPARPVAAATFDTRVNKPRVPGSAARAAHKRLRRLGFVGAAPPESFYVADSEGPLLDGEVERARAWGRDLAAAVKAGRLPLP